MELLAVLGACAIFIGVYLWGYHDGREDERESIQWKRMDELITEVATKKAAEKQRL